MFSFSEAQFQFLLWAWYSSPPCSCYTYGENTRGVEGQMEISNNKKLFSKKNISRELCHWLHHDFKIENNTNSRYVSCIIIFMFFFFFQEHCFFFYIFENRDMPVYIYIYNVYLVEKWHCCKLLFSLTFCERAMRVCEIIV